MKQLHPIFIASLLALALPAAAEVPDMVPTARAAEFIGEFAMVCGVIAAADRRRDLRGDPTFLNFDRPYPDQTFSAVIWARDRRGFDDGLEDLDGYRACVYGKIESYRGRPQMTLTRKEQLNAAPPEP